MSTYLPPNEELTVFNQANFNYNDVDLTTAVADLRYLKLSGGVLTGNLRTQSLLKIADGTETAPSFCFNSDNTTGISGSTYMWFSVAGANKLAVTSTVVEPMVKVLSFPNGTALAPQYTFDGAGSNGKSGMYLAVDNKTVGITSNQILNTSFSDTTTTFALPLRAANGTVAAPSYSFTNDPDCGLYYIGANNLGLAIAGAKIVDYGTAAVAFTLPTYVANGTAAAPSYSFTNDSDCGLYRVGSDSIGFSIAGSKLIGYSSGVVDITGDLQVSGAYLSGNGRISSNGAVDLILERNTITKVTVGTASVTVVDPILAPAGSLSNPSYSFAGDPDTGMYNGLAGNVTFCSNGVSTLLASPTAVRCSTAANNTISCGSSAALWTAVWATDSTINTSDRAKKDDIVNLEADYALLNKLKPSSWTWKHDKARGKNKKRYGLIAQDLEADGITIGLHVEPILDDYNEPTGEIFRGISYADYISPMMAILKDMHKRLESLEKK